MPTGSTSILLPTFQKVVTYFHKLHLNTKEHQGPISYPCICFIRASTRHKLKRESWASREAQLHRFKQGTNITSTSRLWLQSPCSTALQRKAEFSTKGRTAMKGRAQWWQSPVLHPVCCSRWEQEIEKYAMTAASTFQFPPLPHLPAPTFCHYLWDCKHTSMGLSTRTENQKQAKGSGHSILPKI